KKAKEPRGRIPYLSEDERERLFSACKSAGNPRLYPIAALACYSGMRQGEILHLEWSDVDLVDGWAMVCDSKNTEPRRVPVRGPALEALRQWGKVRRLGQRRVFGITFFPGPAWRRAVAAAGIPDFRFHDCRHTAASYLVQSGAGIADIAGI